MWLQFQRVLSRPVNIQSSPRLTVLSLRQHGGRQQRYYLRRSSSSTTTTSAAVVAREQQQRLLLDRRNLAPCKRSSLSILPLRARRFSAKSEKNGNKSAVKKPEELSNLLMEHPVALKTYLEQLTTQQRSEIQQILRQKPPADVAAEAATVEEPSQRALRLVAINTAIPFVGFGVMDNAILIIAGDAIDTSLGVVLGISTLCAAAIGNIISDVFGVLLGTFVEDFTQKYLSVPSPVLTEAQRKLRSVRLWSQAGCAVGIVIGCIIGMFPLLYIDSNKAAARKREAATDAIFQEVVTEAGNLLGAERTFLFVICDKPEEETPLSRGSVIPNPEGKYFYAKYNNGRNRQKHSPRHHHRHEQPFIPLGRGIASRAALTKEAYNITDVSTEPDFISHYGGKKLHIADNVSEEQQSPVQNMLCVPVLDGNDHTIGVLQAINKVGKGLGDVAKKEQMGKQENEKDDDDGTAKVAGAKNRGFTDMDVQILKALASHITVSLQRMMYETDEAHEEEKMRLRDTIRILKDSGLAQVQVPVTEQPRRQPRRPLFPES